MAVLSDTKARKAQPANKDYKLADGNGLYLLVRPGGSKLWRMKYRFANKEKLLSFGPYPEVSIADARDLRDAARKLLREGVDPQIEKKRAALAVASQAGHTFESVAREWHDLQKDRGTPVHQADVLNSLERDVFPQMRGNAILCDLLHPYAVNILRPGLAKWADFTIPTAHHP